MKILIVDDEPLARHELAFLVKQNPQVEQVLEAETIEEALEKMLQAPIDLVFLDIHLTEESGLTLADKLQHFADPPQIIFATAYDAYALRAFDLNATDYILKPFEKERVQQAVEKAVRQKAGSLPVKEVPETLTVTQGDRIFVVKPGQILAVSVENGETTIHTLEAAYTTHEPLASWEKKLPEKEFLQVHRSYLVNLQAIREIQPWFNHTFQITLRNGLKVPVSRSYLKRFREKVGF